MSARSKKIEPFTVIVTTVMVIICFLTLYPIWYTVVLSFNDANDAMLGGIYWWPRQFSMESYKTVLTDDSIISAFIMSLLRTGLGTVSHVFFTAMTAFAFSKKKLIGRNFYLAIGTFTMFFNGGLIPLYLLLKNIGLLNNFLVFIFPTMFNFFHLIIFTSFFKGIPVSLEESAMIDGANELRTFVQIILPLSMPVMATIALFQGVWHWNDFFWGIIFVNDEVLQPIATFLYRMIAESSSSQMKMNMPGGFTATAVNTQSIKLATMVIATAPIVFVYPFMQRYFVKGIMIGSVKG